MSKNTLLFIWIIVLSTSLMGYSEGINDIETLCSTSPQIVHTLMDEINTDYPGLEKVRESVENEDWPSACMALVDYYRNAASASWLRSGDIGSGTGRDGTADDILHDVFTFQSVTGTQPRTANGGLDWLNLGPRNDLEWGYFLNRHAIFVDLLRAWRKTGNNIYPEHFDRLVRDWVSANPAPAENEKTVNWRVLEAGLRMAVTWPESFYGFINTDEFSPTAVIMMLSSVHGHAESVSYTHLTLPTN